MKHSAETVRSGERRYVAAAMAAAVGTLALAGCGDFSDMRPTSDKPAFCDIDRPADRVRSSTNYVDSDEGPLYTAYNVNPGSDGEDILTMTFGNRGEGSEVVAKVDFVDDGVPVSVDMNGTEVVVSFENDRIKTVCTV